MAAWPIGEEAARRFDRLGAVVSQEGMTTRVLLLGEDALTRAGAAALLLGQPQVEVAGQGTLDEAPALLAGLAGPGALDVICWDPGGEAASAGRLLDAAGALPVLALVGPRAPGADLWRDGLRALLDRGAPAAALAAALQAAAQGLSVLGPGLADTFLRVAPPAEADGGPDALTAREREVLALLAEGLGNKAIAARLGVSDHTAKFHVNAILGKLGAATRAEAIVLAVRRGLIAL